MVQVAETTVPPDLFLSGLQGSCGCLARGLKTDHFLSLKDILGELSPQSSMLFNERVASHND